MFVFVSIILDINAADEINEKVEEFPRVITFGDIREHDMLGASIVSISTYCFNLPLTNTVVVRLDSAVEGEEKHIVFQNPCWEQFEGKYSPYSLRPHGFIHDTPDYQLEDETVINVSLFLTKIRKEEEDPSSIELNVESNQEKSFIKTHQRENGEKTFCPNNWWLSGLPERSLEDNEYYSFASCISGLGRTVKTFHFLTGSVVPIYLLAKNSPSYDVFIDHLEGLLRSSEHADFHFSKLKEFQKSDI